MIFAFTQEPTAGTVVRLDDQEFELVGADDYTRRDGTKTALLRWLTPCAQCGEPFEQTTPLTTSSLIRRCASHRKPGKPVKGKRGRKLRVEVIAA